MPSQSTTVLFVELPGLAGLSGSLETKELQALLALVHEMADTTVRLHQGIVSSFSGDSFMAVFVPSKSGSATGMPAIEACEEFRERMESLLKEKKLFGSIGFKAGIASGDAVITRIGDEETNKVTVMGPAVNFATRLREFAEAGQVLVNGAIYEAVKDQYDFQKLEPLPIRGSKESLATFELMGRKRKKINLEAFSERKIASEMVGRIRETEILEGQIKKLINGKGSVVNIVGKAGIGKSRLMAETRVQPFMKKVVMLEGRALSMGKSLSFHPLIHIIKSWASITEDDSPALSVEKLRRSVMRAAPEQAGEIFPFIATMMGLPLTGTYKDRVAGIEGEALEKLILKNLRDLISAASTARPIILIIEDMHWADGSSISFLESLFKLVQKNRVMFINVFRPGYEDTGDYMLKYLEEKLPEDHLTIEVDSLEATAGRELIGNLLNQTALPDEVTEMIIRKTEGNPFFIEEVIRSFIDEGVIELQDNGFRVNEEIQHVNIPETINEVILSRVDKLDEKTKELLKTASVIGRNFYYKVLEEAADTIGELDERLEYLKEVQLIGESKKKDEIEYLFKHALAQQATYESIVLNTKKELHLKIARSIEKVFAGNIQEFYGTLAYHYEKGENREKAEEYLFMAGKDSLNSGAPLQALNFFKKGLEIYLTLSSASINKEKLADYYYHLGLSCHSGGYNIETINYIEKFQEIYKLGVPNNRIVLVFGTIIRLIKLILAVNFKQYFFRQRVTPLQDIFIKSIAAKAESMVTIDPKSVFFETIYFSEKLIKWDLSQTQYGEGVFTEICGNFIWTGISVLLGRKMLKVYEPSISKEKKLSWMKMRYLQIELKLFTGDFTPDLDEDDVYFTGMQAGAFWETTTYVFFSMYIHIENGNFIRAQDLSLRMLEIADSFENVHAHCQYYRITSVLMIKSRRLDEVMKISREGIDYTSKTGHLALTLVIQCCRIIALSLSNKLEEAAEILGKAKIIAMERKRGVIFFSTYLVAKAHYEIAFARISFYDDKINADFRKKMIMTSNELIKYSKKYAGNLIEAYRLSGIIYRMTGNQRKALSNFKKAIAFGETSGGRLELSRSYFELGKFLSDPKTKHMQLDGLTGKDYLEKARTMFEEMGLDWDLEQWRRFSE